MLAASQQPPAQVTLALNGPASVTLREPPIVTATFDREKLRQIDLHWHDGCHEGACRLLADGVDIRTIQLTNAGAR